MKKLKEYTYLKYFDNGTISQLYEYRNGRIIHMTLYYFNGKVKVDGTNVCVDSNHEDELLIVYLSGELNYYYENGKLEQTSRIVGDSCLSVHYDMGGREDYRKSRIINCATR